MPDDDDNHDDPGGNGGPGPAVGAGEPRAQPLTMYGEPSTAEPLEWEWVAVQLAAAGTYWVVPAGGGVPHPRPVWGVWDAGALHLSVGSPVVARRLHAHPEVVVHLDSGTDVVLVEGRVAGTTTDDRLIDLYNAKYDWSYSLRDYGPLTTVAAVTVIAWRAAGWAGRDGFDRTGRWRF